MEVIYQEPLGPILFIIALLCLQVLPKNVEAMYFKENILRKERTASKILEWFNLAILFISYLLMQINYGFNGFLSYIILIVFITYLTYFVFGAFFSKRKDNQLISVNNVYYGLADVADIMNDLSDRYQEITIKRSPTNAPLSVSIVAKKQERIDYLLEMLLKESMFEDLNQRKFKVMLPFFTIGSLISIIYLVSLALYHLITLI